MSGPPAFAHLQVSRSAIILIFDCSEDGFMRLSAHTTWYASRNHKVPILSMNDFGPRMVDYWAGVTATMPQFTEFTFCTICPALKLLKVALFPGVSGGLLKVKLV